MEIFKFKQIIVTMPILCCLLPYPSNANDFPSGYWSPNCSGFGGSINIIKAKDIKIDVNSNNLLISATLKGSKGDYFIYYNDVEETMNEITDWDAVSLDKPIAKIAFHGNSATMDWLGFYDNAKHKYIWSDKSDFNIYSKKSKKHLFNEM